MIRSIVGSALKFRYLVLAVAIALMALGGVQLRNMPVDVLPEFSPPYVEIQTEALGLSAKEVEQLITVPIEQDLLSGVAWIDTIKSKSVPGMSSIVLLFEPGTDIYRARQMVSERMTQAHALPHVSKPPTMLQPLSATSRFIIVGLSSKDVSPIQMSVLARWTVVPRLMSVPGVANVAVWGQRDRQLQVQVDPERLRANNVTLQQVLGTTGNALWVSSLSFLEASSPGTGGFIDTPQQRLGIWHVSPISSANELGKVVIEHTNLRLNDIANVVEDHQPLIGDAITSDNPGLVLVIEKLPDANTLNVTQGVEDALEQMKPGLTGIDINTGLFRPASYIQSAFSNLGWALLVSAILVVVALLLFLSSWRSAVIALVALVLSVAAALFVLHQRGATLNAMLLTGLVVAIGVLLDEAINDADHLVRQLRQLNKPDSAVREGLVIESSLHMRNALMPATLIVLLLVMPIFFIQGVTGSFFEPLILSYGLAVLAALIVATLVIPGLSLILAPNSDGKTHETPIARGLQSAYSGLLSPITRSPRLGYILLAVLAIVSLAAVPVLMQQRAALPTFRESDVVVNLDGAPGASHPAMVRMVNQASQELRAIPGIRNVSAHIGRAVFGDEVVGINSAKLWINLDPSADYEATLAQIETAVAGYSGGQQGVGTPSVQTYLRSRSSQVAQGADANALAVRVFGENLDTLKVQAETVRQAIANINGVADAQLNLPIEEPSVEIRVDLAKAERYGLKPGDVRRAAAILLSGLQVGSLFENQKIFDVVVWSTPATRQSLTAIRELLIDTPAGGRVRLQDVADVVVASTPNIIQRESISPYIDVAFAAQGRSPDAVAADVQTTVQAMQFPLEYHARVVGGFEEQQAVQQRTLIAILVAALGIFLLLQVVCERWPLTLVVFLVLPLSLAGGLLVAWLAGGSLSLLGVLGGLLAVFGIAVRNSLSTIGHLHHLQHEKIEPFGPELVMRGARERAVPILTTALVTALAFLPFIVLGNRPGLEIARQIAFVVLGGLVSATLLNLFVIPAVYLALGRTPEAAPWMSDAISPMPTAPSPPSSISPVPSK
jgi:CzcA family heavy metal efflux pump